MMLVLRDTLQPWRGERINGILYQPNIGAIWNDAKLNAIGLYKPVPFACPAGHKITGAATYEWNGSAVVEVRPVAPLTYSAQDVKAEAQRRIMALMGTETLEACTIKQLNANMRANELNAIRHERAWTAEEAAEATALTDMAAAVKAIRAASNTIEQIDPIPADYAHDARWP